MSTLWRNLCPGNRYFGARTKFDRRLQHLLPSHQFDDPLPTRRNHRNQHRKLTSYLLLRAISRNVACNRSTFTGLIKCSVNPTARLFSRSSSIPNPLRAMPAIDCCARIWRIKSCPLPSGKPMSLTSKSNFDSFASCSACLTVSAHATS